MKFIIPLITFVLVTKSFGELSPEGKVKVYKGKEGVVISILQVKPKKDEKYLITFENSGKPYDGKTLLHAKTPTSHSNYDFTTEWDGKAGYITLYSRDEGLYLPLGYQKETHLSYSEDLSKSADAQQMINRYFGKRNKVAKGAGAEFDRDDAVKGDEKVFNAALATMNEACGTKITAKIDWTSFKDDAVRELEVGEKCKAPLLAIEKLCDDDEGKKTISSKIKTVTCKLGGKADISVGGSGVQFTTAKDAPDQEAKAKQYLGEKL